MPQTKFQKLVFGSMMAFIMVYGMEVYNALLRTESAPFLIRMDELLTLSVIVYLLQTSIGGPLARWLAFKFVSPISTPRTAFFVTISAFTVVCMCPLMSMVATLMFRGPNDMLVAWGKTTVWNFPMAFFWQILIAGPLVRLLFKKMFPIHA